MMLENNKLGIKPGVYSHISTGGIYVVMTAVTHVKKGGIWFKLPDPYVVYRNLETQYEEIDGKKTEVMKHYMKKLSEFKERFKPE